MQSIYSLLRCLFLSSILLISTAVEIESLQVLETVDADHDFSVELIHYDSPRSPFYVASETPADRALKSIRRSRSRLNYFNTLLSNQYHITTSSTPDVVTTVVPEVIDGEYLMTINVGTPPVKRIVIADTGSGLMWIQCKPCKVCFKQDYPLFDPRKSSSYRLLNCKTDVCESLSRVNFKSCGVHGHCMFNYSYGDNSVAIGDLAAETFTFETLLKTKIRIPNLPLGCSYYSSGKYQSAETGLVGLGLAKTSLVTQIGPLVGWRFAHCLVPKTLPKASSILSFGNAAAKVTAPGAVTLPYFPLSGQVYAVNLLKISIGKKKSVQFAIEERTVILDTGTHVSILPTRIVKKLVYAVAAIVGDGDVDDPSETYPLCYPSVHSFESKLPSMTFGFVGGDVAVGPSNLFEKVSHNLTCLAMVPDDGLSIIGNLFMVNHKYAYDIKLKTVTIAPTDCTKHA